MPPLLRPPDSVHDSRVVAVAAAILVGHILRPFSAVETKAGFREGEAAAAAHSGVPLATRGGTPLNMAWQLPLKSSGLDKTEAKPRVVPVVFSARNVFVPATLFISSPLDEAPASSL